VNERLYRSRDDRVIAGVAGGLADAIDVDPSIVRIAWVILTFLSGGLLLVVYVVMAIVVPQEPLGAPLMAGGVPGGSGSTGGGPAPTPGGSAPIAGGVASPETGLPTADADWRAARRLERQRLRAERRARGEGFPATAVLGVLLVIVGAIFLARRFLPDLDFDLLWPIIVVGLGAALILSSFRRGDDRSGPTSPSDPGAPASST
jgi:phage shock protein C